MVTAHLTLFKDGVEIGQLYPARWFFRKHETEPTTEVRHTPFALRRRLRHPGVVRNRGISQSTFSSRSTRSSTGSGSGSPCWRLERGIALLPESTFAFMAAKVPAGAATTSGLVLALVLGGLTTSARAQPPPVQMAELTAEQQTLEAELKTELVCVCGGCSHLPVVGLHVQRSRSHARVC